MRIASHAVNSDGCLCNTDHDGIYDSLILPQVKLLQIRKKAARRFCQGSDSKGIWLIFPMVVLRDFLYAYDLTKEPRKLRKENRVSFVRQLDTPGAKGSFMVDFVTSEYLTEFINKDIARFTDQIGLLVEDRFEEILGK